MNNACNVNSVCLGALDSLKLPKDGFHYGYTCADCAYFNPQDRNKYGDPWCDKHGRYETSRKVCGAFKELK